MTVPSVPLLNGMLDSDISAIDGYLYDIQSYLDGIESIQAESSFINVKAEGALGDGVSNDTNVLAKAFTTTGAIVYIPSGVYRVSGTIIPTCAAIIGAGQNTSILKPTQLVTKVLSIGAVGYPSMLTNFQIDGSAITATSAIGIVFGDTGSWSGCVNNVLVQGFNTTGSTAVRIGNALKSRFSELTCYGNKVGMVVQGVTGDFPTTCTFDNCVFSNNSQYGVRLYTGYNVTFCNNCDFESNTLEGLLVQPVSGGVCTGINLHDCWFEDNNSGNVNEYHCSFDSTSGGGATVRFSMINCHWAGSNRRVLCTGTGTRDFVIIRPDFDSDVASSFTCTNSAFGQVLAWPESRSWSGNVSSNGLLSSAEATWNSYTPVYSSNVGNAAATFSGAVTTLYARYRKDGKSLHLYLMWAGTLNAVTPQYIEVTLPTGLSSATNAVYHTIFVEDSAVQLMGLGRPDGGNKVRFHKLNGALYTSSAAIAGYFTGVIEVA